jgi:multiple sugar transport system substrate-binding protein
MKKILIVCLVLLAGAGMLFASGTGETGAVTIRWAYWGGENRVKISQQAIDLFMKQNPGITVNPEVSPGSGAHFEKVNTQLAGKAGPDIIQMGSNINDYVSKNQLLPLDKYTGITLITSVIDSGANDMATIGGKLYGVTTGVNMPALVYNKTMIEKAGVALPKTTMTYDEFRAFLVELKGKLPAGVFPMQDIGALSNNSTPFGYWSRVNGSPLYDKVNGTTAMTAAFAQKYLELFKDYRDNGLVPPADVAAGYAEQNADSAAIVAGKVAVSFLWSNQLAGYQGAMKDELNFIEMPGAGSKRPLWQAPSQFYTVNAASQNPDAAVKFINFLVNSPDAAKILGNDRGTSASATARAAELATPIDQKVFKYIAVAGPHSSKQTPTLPNDTEFNSTLYLIYQSVAFGKVTPADGGKQIFDLITRLIKK